MSNQSETVEDVLAEMEAHGSDGQGGEVGSYDRGYCVASRRWAERLRAAMERQS